jgi:hypothetical protein
MEFTMTTHETLSSEFIIELPASSPSWGKIPDNFIGIRDPKLVVSDYTFKNSDTTTLPWNYEVFNITFNNTNKDFTANKKEDSCITDTLVNDKRGSSFTLVSLYDSCLAVAKERPWILGNREEQGSFYGIHPAVSTLIDTYGITSLFSAPLSKSDYKDDDDGLTSGSNTSISNAKVCKIDSIADALTSSDSSINIKSLYEVSVKNPDGTTSKKMVGLDDTNYFTKMKGFDDPNHKNYGKYEANFETDGCLMSKTDITVADIGGLTGGGMVAVQGCSDDTDDIPHYLNYKLITSEDADTIPIDMETVTMPVPCSDSSGQLMNALTISLAKKNVYPTLNMGPLSSVFTTNTENTVTKDIEIQEVADIDNGYLRKTNDGWTVEPVIIDIKDSNTIGYSLDDNNLYVKYDEDTIDVNDKGLTAKIIKYAAGTGIAIDTENKISIDLTKEILDQIYTAMVERAQKCE